MKMFNDDDFPLPFPFPPRNGGNQGPGNWVILAAAILPSLLPVLVERVSHEVSCYYKRKRLKDSKSKEEVSAAPDQGELQEEEEEELPEEDVSPTLKTKKKKLKKRLKKKKILVPIPDEEDEESS